MAMPIIPLVDKPLEEEPGLVPFCGPVVTASVELDCQDMEVELVLLARVIEELEKVVAEPDKLLVVEGGEPPGICSYSVNT
jgi:hypothetical protein